MLRTPIWFVSILGALLFACPLFAQEAQSEDSTATENVTDENAADENSAEVKKSAKKTVDSKSGDEQASDAVEKSSASEENGGATKADKKNETVGTAQQAALGVGGGSGDSLLGDFLILYGLDTTLGMSTIRADRPALTHTLRLTGAYKLTSKETILAGGSVGGEFFTRSNGSNNYINVTEFNPLWAAIQSRRISGSIGDVKAFFIPEFRLFFPVSENARSVSAYYLSWRLRATTTLMYKNLFVTFLPELRYTHFKATHVNFERSNSQAQDGRLNAPLFTRLLVIPRYQLTGKWGVSGYYGISASRTYENEDGNAYWRNAQFFGLSTDYTFFPWLTVSLSYDIAQGLVDGQGDVRNPFASKYADWGNSSTFTLGISGTIN